MRTLRRILIYILLIAVLPLAFGPTETGYAQSLDEWYCEDTQKTVRGAYFDYYFSTPDHLAIFGFPITNAKIDEMGRHYQYFQKGRMDLNPNTGEISLAPLGSYLYSPGKYKDAGFNNASQCHLFPNGFSVCYDFFRFYKANNGKKYLGLPISNTEITADGYFIQYFEYGALQFYPNQPKGEKTKILELGYAYKDIHLGKDPLPGDTGSRGPTAQPIDPQIDVFTSKAIVTANSEETIFVIAKDANHTPIPQAQVTIKITLPDGSTSTFYPAATDQDGITSLSIQIGNIAPREVINIEAQVSVTGYEEAFSGTTWFRIWW